MFILPENYTSRLKTYNARSQFSHEIELDAEDTRIVQGLVELYRHNLPSPALVRKLKDELTFLFNYLYQNAYHLHQVVPSTVEVIDDLVWLKFSCANARYIPIDSPRFVGLNAADRLALLLMERVKPDRESCLIYDAPDSEVTISNIIDNLNSFRVEFIDEFSRLYGDPSYTGKFRKVERRVAILVFDSYSWAKLLMESENDYQNLHKGFSLVGSTPAACVTTGSGIIPFGSFLIVTAMSKTPIPFNFTGNSEEVNQMLLDHEVAVCHYCNHYRMQAVDKLSSRIEV